MEIKNTNFEGAIVHPNAFVDSSAELHDGVSIASGAIIGPNVVIESGTQIGPNAVIEGKTKIGKNNKVFPNVFIGLEPQDLKYKGASTEVVIGDNNTFRDCFLSFVSCFINSYTFSKSIIIPNNYLCRCTLIFKLSLIHI